MKYVGLILLGCVGLALGYAGLWLADGWMAVKAGLVVTLGGGGLALAVVAVINLRELIDKRRKDGQRDS